jgi:iron complex outermembrane receptor protein
VIPADAYQQKNSYTSRVVYLQDQASVGSWHLLGSLRYSKIDVTDVNPDPMFGTNNVSTNTRLTPRLGAVYDWSPTVSSFVGYSEGIKVPTGSNFAAPPKPEESKQKEIGLKLKNWAGVTATLAWFDLERMNSSVTDPMTYKAYQTGKQRSHGVDLDLQWRAAKGLTLLAALAHQKVEIVDDLKPALVGKRLFNVPETTARLAARYDFFAGDWAGWGMGLGVTHHDKLPGNNTNSFFTPSAQVWDAQLSYQTKLARYGLNVSNLLDKQYFVPSAYFGGGQVIPAAPHALTASAVFSF